MSETIGLKSKAITGSLWSLAESFSVQIVQFIVGIILARILDPKDYGLIALTGIFLGISAAITDGGFEKTIIQKRDLLPIQLSTLFYINVILGVFLTIVHVILAPYISQFFNAPGLTPILQVVSFTILFTSLVQIQQTIILKELKFKKISQIRIATSIIGGITALILALRGFGVWALVYAVMVPQIFRVLFFWIRSSWYPQLKFSFSSVQTLIPYGLNVLGSSILYFMIGEFNVFIVGKFYTKTELGLYNRGNRFPGLVGTIIQSVVLKMSLPIFSKIQDQPIQLLETAKKINKVVAFISFPLLLLLLIKAEDITILLFTEKWRGSIIFLQLFCIVSLFSPFISIHRELILAQGLSKLLLKLFMVLSIVEILLVLIVLKFGIAFIVYSMIISKIIQFFTYSIINSKRLGSYWVNELVWYMPYIITTLLMCLTIFISEYLISHCVMHFSLFWKVTFQLFLGIISYLYLAYKFKIAEVSLVNSVAKTILQKIRI